MTSNKLSECTMQGQPWKSDGLSAGCKIPTNNYCEIWRFTTTFTTACYPEPHKASPLR